MSIRYKIDVLAALKAAGYSTARIRNEKILGESYLQRIRKGELISWNALDVICTLLQCRIEDVIEHIPENSKSVSDNI